MCISSSRRVDVETQTRHGCSGLGRKELIIIKTGFSSWLYRQSLLFLTMSVIAVHLEMPPTSRRHPHAIPTACAFSLFQAQGPPLKLVRSSKWKILS